MTGFVLHTLFPKLLVADGAVSVCTIQPLQIGIFIDFPVRFWSASVLSFPSLAPMLGIRPYEVLQLARVGMLTFHGIPSETHLFSQQKHSSQSFDSSQRSFKAIEPTAHSSSGPRDMSPSRGTVVSAPSSPPTLTSSNRAAPSLSKLNFNTKPSFAGFASNSVVRGIPIAESDAKSSSATALESSGYCPSACDDGSLVCKRCHEIIMPHEIQSHDSTCETNQNSPLVDARASPRTRFEKGAECSGASVQGVKHGFKAPAGSLGSRAQSSRSAGDLFSFSDIQSRFNAKKAALLQKPFADEVITGATRRTCSKVNPRQLTRRDQAQTPASRDTAPHKSTRSGGLATDRNKCKAGAKSSAVVNNALFSGSSECSDSHVEESSARGGDGCAENDFPDHYEQRESNASSSSDSDMLLISPSRSEDLASVLSPRTRSSRSILSGSSNAAFRKSAANVRPRRHDDRPNPSKLRRIQNETNTPVLRSETAANISPCLPTRPATLTDRTRGSDQADCSSSYCFECGLGGGVLLVTVIFSQHRCIVITA